MPPARAVGKRARAVVCAPGFGTKFGGTSDNRKAIPMNDDCLCGHHSHFHVSDPSGCAGSPCGECACRDFETAPEASDRDRIAAILAENCTNTYAEAGELWAVDMGTVSLHYLADRLIAAGVIMPAKTGE